MNPVYFPLLLCYHLKGLTETITHIIQWSFQKVCKSKREACAGPEGTNRPYWLSSASLTLAHRLRGPISAQLITGLSVPAPVIPQECQSVSSSATALPCVAMSPTELGLTHRLMSQPGLYPALLPCPCLATPGLGLMLGTFTRPDHDPYLQADILTWPLQIPVEVTDSLGWRLPPPACPVALFGFGGSGWQGPLHCQPRNPAQPLAPLSRQPLAHAIYALTV